MKRSIILSGLGAIMMFLVSCGGGGGGGAAVAVSPAVSSTTPQDGATGVAITASPTATFDRALDPATVTTGTFTLQDSAGHAVTGTVSLTGGMATFKPSSVLAVSTRYTASLTTGIKDTSGNPMATGFSWSFTTTSDATLPTVTSTTPATGATNIQVTTPITITFSEAMNPASVNASTVLVKDSLNNPVTGSIAMNGANTTATFTPAANLNYGTVYTVTVTTGVRNQSGNNMLADYIWSFTTLPAFGSWVATPTAGAPAMSGHTAVWTGTEMIVFDGTSGSRYNPALGTWTQIADFVTAFVPPLTTRVGHTAVWTGTGMIVWGGYDPNAHAAVNTGAMYTPGAAGTAGAWTELSGNPVGPIAPRYGHSAIWDTANQQMIVWGGFNPATGAFYNDGAIFRPGNNNWFTLNASPLSPRQGHVAVWTGTQMIVWGGTNSAGALLNDGAILSPPLGGNAGGAWASISTVNAPTPTGGPLNAVWTGTEMIVWGGNASGAYNPGTDSWRSISMVNAPPVTGTAVWTGSLMLVWDNGIGGRYDPVGDVWTAITTTGAPTPRSGHSAVWSGTEMIIYGGAGGPGLTILNTGGRYTP